MVSGEIRQSHGCASPGMGSHRHRQPYADRGADRLGQNACGFAAVPRPDYSRESQGIETYSWGSDTIHNAAQGAKQRYSPPCRRIYRGAGAVRRSGAGEARSGDGSRTDRRYVTKRARGYAADAAGRAGDDAGVALPHDDVAEGPRHPEDGPAGDRGRNS